MVKIQKQVTAIPVDFGEFELYFYKSDENMKRAADLQGEFEQVFKTFGKDEDKTFKDLEVIKNQLHTAFDGLFGEGSFDKVYQFADGSTLHTLIYFLQALDGISKEFNLDNETKAINKYLKV